MTGYASTLAGIQRLLKIIDQKPKNLEPQFLKRELKYAVADELRPLLKDLVTAYRSGPQGRPGQPPPAQSPLSEPEPEIIADGRTNSLLVAASEETLRRINSWIDQLDVEEREGELDRPREGDRRRADSERPVRREELRDLLRRLERTRRAPERRGGHQIL
jgi:hypothetical protein